MESLDFDFLHLDNFIGLSRLADKKRQETKQTYCADKQKINTTKINENCITTKRPAGNTYASCGRDDPARKHRLNRISFADFQFPLAGSLI